MCDSIRGDAFHFRKKHPWTAAYQAPPSIGFSTQEYWSGVPFPSPLGKNTGVDNQSLGEGNGTPLQYSCLENPMDGGAW